jgi:hypothetical protein
VLRRHPGVDLNEGERSGPGGGEVSVKRSRAASARYMRCHTLRGLKVVMVAGSSSRPSVQARTGALCMC